MLRRVLVPLVLVPLVLAAACRPDSHGQRVQVHVPREDVATLPWRAVPPDGRVEVPPGTMPRVLRPHPRVKVEVPADEMLPRRMIDDGDRSR